MPRVRTFLARSTDAHVHLRGDAAVNESDVAAKRTDEHGDHHQPVDGRTLAGRRTRPRPRTPVAATELRERSERSARGSELQHGRTCPTHVVDREQVEKPTDRSQGEHDARQDDPDATRPDDTRPATFRRRRALHGGPPTAAGSPGKPRRVPRSNWEGRASRLALDCPTNGHGVIVAPGSPARWHLASHAHPLTAEGRDGSAVERADQARSKTRRLVVGSLFRALRVRWRRTSPWRLPATACRRTRRA